MIRGHELQEVVGAGLAPSVRWLQAQIRAKKIPGHKVGRHWIMTDADIEAALEVWASEPKPAAPAATPLSLTATSLRRHKAAS